MSITKNQPIRLIHTFGRIINWFVPKSSKKKTTEHLRYQSVIALSLIIGSSGFPFIFIFYVMGYPHVAAVVLWSFAAFYFIPFICRWGASVKVASHLVSINYYQCHFCLAMLFGGISAPNTMWFIALPMIAILTGGISHGVLWGMITTLSILGLYGLELYELVYFPKALNSEEILFIHSLGSIGLTYAVLSSACAYELLKESALDQRKRAERQLLNANQEVETLLHNILPIPIVSRLKAGEKTIADEFQNVSVLFFDIVGFTMISERMSPSELVHLLNDLFTMMDHIVERYKLLKVKTIGDAYMVAAGVPVVQLDHAERLALCAIDMMVQFNKWKNQAHQKYNQDLDIRMGINSGSLVAGVIGRSNFAYDVWGDTVNIAARMESHGLANHIQMSEATYSLIKNDDRFQVIPRGEIEVKGKGVMNVYFLTAATST